MTEPRTDESILILDFGSQYTQLIARRVRECGVFSEIQPCTVTPDQVDLTALKGLILSGGPASVTEPGAPGIDPAWYALGLPTLGICYGMQLTAVTQGGATARSESREYGPAIVHRTGDDPLWTGLPEDFRVWMSHGDHVRALPEGYHSLAVSGTIPHAAMVHPGRKVYGLQFHPEVVHTEYGTLLIDNFVRRVCGCRCDWTPASFVDTTVARLRAQYPEGNIICGVSGGVDSTTLAVLLHRAFGDRLYSIFVDNGVLRLDEAEQVRRTFAEHFHIPLRFIDATSPFLDALAGITDPETKRKAIGRVFIEVFEEAARAIPDVRYLAQGTLYPDVIESVSFKGPSAVIKSHHNVGGLPERMHLSLIEPFRELFKDEVRQVGRELSMPAEILDRHPFPGPGLAIRILGEVTPERLVTLRGADAIFLGELRSSGLYDQVWQALSVLLPVQSVGVMGDERTYESVCALRAVTSVDGMTADFAHLPPEFLSRVAARIINEVKGINRVVYDISSKPPATIEWE